MFPTTILLILSFAALSFGASIHKRSKDATGSLDQLSCLALSDGSRLSFQNKADGNMENKLASAGERVELRCQVVAAPQATIRWKHNGVFLDKETTRHGQARIENADMPIIGLGTTISVLVIECLDSETAGHYSCIAENGCSEAIETSAIVAVKPDDMEQQASCSLPPQMAPKLVFWTDTILERPEATVTLYCRATGHPRPEIEWFEEDDAGEYQKVEKDDKNHKLLSNGDMVIHGQSADSEDSKPSAGYKCVATNELGSDSMETVVVRATL